MENSYYTWDEYVANFGREMREAIEVFEQMKDGGSQENEIARFDFTFESDTREKLIALRSALIERYKYEVDEIASADELFELKGNAGAFPVSEDNVMYWVLDMAKVGQEFDSKLTGYGGLGDGDQRSFPDLTLRKEDEYFELGVTAYNSGNLSAALINWSLVIEINPENADAYYSRAIVKHELHTWKAALRDYDRAIDLQPNHVAALINRGALKDDHGDSQGAIADYDKAIEIAGTESKRATMAYFNRGNAKLKLDDRKGACEDWKKSRDLGSEYAEQQIQKYCDE